ncbi:MAG: acetamidase/formamidase family protein [Deltaproteobacteria bacterium]|nr:acetamidase/formamidase family protein [Deltaproteobacteria bacterium]
MRLTCIEDHLHYAFSADLPPVLTVNPGQRLVVETLDASHGQIRPGRDVPVDRSRLLPITGPVAVAGARPGDALQLSFEQIEFSPVGHAWVRPGLGILELDAGKPLYVREFRVSDRVEVAPGVSIPLRPMLGIVGVATPEPTPARLPGVHGGNLDCVDVTTGNQLLLPVLAPGGNLSLGDAHAAMGEGEVSGSGIEIAATVTFTVDLIPDAGLDGPVVLTPHKTAFLASEASLDRAVPAALQRALRALTERGGQSPDEAYLTASIAGNARICQVVNGLVTAAFELPREVFQW